MDLEGQKLGKYELIEKLGQGGMAQVYKARQPMIERLVAIKLMQSHLSENKQFVDRFLREAQRLGQLRHPNIVSVIDFDIIENTHFLVMDFVSGPTLQTYLEQRGKLPLGEALRLASQIASALQYAHEKGVIHCDLKPPNVMFQDMTYDQVVLTDFGIARLVDTSGMAQTSTVIGTPTYMSPEQVQGQPLDGRADIYSLGVMLYEMISGKPPYVGDTPVSIIMKHVNEPPPNLNLIDPSVPVEVAQIVEKALAKSSADRYTNALEMRKAIESALRHLTETRATIRLDGAKSEEVVGSSVAMVETSDPSSVRTSAVVAPQAPQVGVPTRKLLPVALIGGLAAMVVVGLIAGFLIIRNVFGKPRQSVLATATTVLVSASPIAGEATATSEGPISGVSPTDIVVVLDIEQNRYGSLMVFNDSEGTNNQVYLVLGAISAAPSGKQYAAWIGSDQQLSFLGSVIVAGGLGRLSAVLSPDQVKSLQKVIITLEASEQTPSAPSGEVLFSGELSPDQNISAQQLAVSSGEATGKPYLAAIVEQALAAYGHQVYQVDSMATNDLNEARSHAEHIVNILEGKGVGAFGDLNGDGRVENPGDDVGVRQYIIGAINQVQTLADSAPQTNYRHANATKAIPYYQQSLEAMDKVIELNQKLLASQDTAEMANLAQQAKSLFEAMMMGENSMGGFWMGNYYASRVMEIPLVALSSEGQLPALSPESFTLAAFSPTGREYTFTLLGLPAASKGLIYTLWVGNSSDGSFQILGSLSSDQFSLEGKLPTNYPDGFSQVVLSMEVEGSQPSAPGRQVVVGPIVVEAANFLSNISLPADSAPLAKADEQAAVAVEHLAYLLDAIEQNNLPLAKRHTEHIINILEGEEGEHFGDVNGDGNLQNPGDSTGVLGYLKSLGEIANALPVDQFGDSQKRILDHFLNLQQNTIEALLKCFEGALKILSSDTAEEAQRNAEAFSTQVTAVVSGQDLDGNGVIDPYTGEGGLAGLRLLAESLGEVGLVFPAH